ncbi:MAG: cyclic 2,3-diphosphoglycerate synthase, partial [Spirochaetota bacterium]
MTTTERTPEAGAVGRRVIIMGAAGRDFHNFLLRYRDDAETRVVAFTAAQIPDIGSRVFPPGLAGERYPEGIPIFPEERLPELIRDLNADQVVFSYSDISHREVMHRASLVLAEGAGFALLGPGETMLASRRPVVSVCAVRTGCGKSQTTREVCRITASMGLRTVAVRHPMPYGDLKRQAAQRFCSYRDFGRHRCTIEEREEYEPLVDMGVVVYAGVDYRRILRQAEEEAQVIVWDGGNNDLPFFVPDLHLVLFDPHRAGHELCYHPGETNMRMADVAVINKVDSAGLDRIEQVKRNIAVHAPRAAVVLAESRLLVSDPGRIRGKRVLVVEDGPTLTHGGMPFGAGMRAAEEFGATLVVDPRQWAEGSIRETYHRHPHIGPVLPAMGYSPGQVRELERTINRCDCDLVIFATPIQLTRVLSIR